MYNFENKCPGAYYLTSILFNLNIVKPRYQLTSIQCINIPSIIQSRYYLTSISFMVGRVRVLAPLQPVHFLAPVQAVRGAAEGLGWALAVGPGAGWYLAIGLGRPCGVGGGVASWIFLGFAVILKVAPHQQISPQRGVGKRQPYSMWPCAP